MKELDFFEEMDKEMSIDKKNQLVTLKSRVM